MTKADAAAKLASVWDSHGALTLRTKSGAWLPAESLAMTIAHGDMDEILDHLPGPEWEHLRRLRAEAVNQHCREYPGAWVKAARDALTSAKKGADHGA